MDFLEEVEGALEKLTEVGAEDAMTITANVGYDVYIKEDSGFLTIGYGYKYLDAMVNELRPSVEAEGELTMEEYVDRAKSKVERATSREALEFFKQAFLHEYQKTRAHLDWLEEELELDE